MLNTKQREHIKKDFKIPVDHHHPRQSWILCIDEDSTMPTDFELRQIQSLCQFKIENTYREHWQADILSKPLPLCDGHNTAIFRKGTDEHPDAWLYRQLSWHQTFAPYGPHEKNQRPRCLEEILNNQERYAVKHWSCWKEQHPNIFPPFTAGMDQVHRGGSYIVYQILLKNGHIREAVIDPSQQCSADGKQWRDNKTMIYIDKYEVIGSREVPPQT